MSAFDKEDRRMKTEQEVFEENREEIMYQFSEIRESAGYEPIDEMDAWSRVHTIENALDEIRNLLSD
jgi:hypothetical protein